VSGACSTNRRDYKYIKILSESVKGRNHLKVPRCRGGDNIRMDLKQSGKVWTWYIWLRI
jgi:hypothetical protein